MVFKSDACVKSARSDVVSTEEWNEERTPMKMEQFWILYMFSFYYNVCLFYQLIHKTKCIIYIKIIPTSW